MVMVMYIDTVILLQHTYRPMDIVLTNLDTVISQLYNMYTYHITYKSAYTAWPISPCRST